MSNLDKISYVPWPQLSYEEFKPTMHLLHMGAQAMGKLKLQQPFEPHWDGVPLWLTSSGLSTGPLNYNFGVFSIDMDFINHCVICKSSWGQKEDFRLEDMSVATFTTKLFNSLKKINIHLSVNPMPTEIPNPIPFDQDSILRPYNPSLTQQWWHIMLSTQRVMQRYHARFSGRTPPIGLMWGTLDLRDVRYKGKPMPVDTSMDFIRRNAMDDAQIEIGWWAGNETYPRPAFFSFTYPPPAGIEKAKIAPAQARWDTAMKEFILDYDDLLKSKQPEEDLLSFFDSTYEAGAQRANWNANLLTSGKPL